MEVQVRSILWHQFGAAIDMIEKACHACPDSLWDDRSQKTEFWYTVFHALFWLDLYLSGSIEGFHPPAPFTLDELDPAGIVPANPYTKVELLTYLDYCRTKCRNVLGKLTDGEAARECAFGWGKATFLELILYNMRHVQHHAAQLYLMLRRETDSTPGWVAQTKS